MAVITPLLTDNLRLPRFVSDMSLRSLGRSFQSKHFERIGLEVVKSRLALGAHSLGSNGSDGPVKQLFPTPPVIAQRKISSQPIAPRKLVRTEAYAYQLLAQRYGIRV